MSKISGGFGALLFLLAAGCAPAKSNLADYIVANRWANDPLACNASYITLNNGEMSLHENGKVRKHAFKISLKDLPDSENSVALELHYPDEPEGKNKGLIVLQLQSEILVPKGLALQGEGYTLVTKRDDPFIQAFTLHRCA